jgi:hypothetical protein
VIGGGSATPKFVQVQAPLGQYPLLQVNLHRPSKLPKPKPAVQFGAATEVIGVIALPQLELTQLFT